MSDWRDLENWMVLDADKYEAVHDPETKVCQCANCGEWLDEGDEAYYIGGNGEYYCEDCCRPCVIGMMD